MTAILIAGFGLWLFAKVSKVLFGVSLLVLFLVFPMKALVVLLILIALSSLM